MEQPAQVAEHAVGRRAVVRQKGKIPGYTLFADWGKDMDDIHRLNHTGTHPVHTDLAVGNALDTTFTAWYRPRRRA